MTKPAPPTRRRATAPIALLCFCAGFALGWIASVRPQARSAYQFPERVEVWQPADPARPLASPPRLLRVFRVMEGGETFDLGSPRDNRQPWKIVLDGPKRVVLFGHLE